MHGDQSDTYLEEPAWSPVLQSTGRRTFELVFRLLLGFLVDFADEYADALVKGATAWGGGDGVERVERERRSLEDVQWQLLPCCTTRTEMITS